MLLGLALLMPAVALPAPAPATGRTEATGGEMLGVHLPLLIVVIVLNAFFTMAQTSVAAIGPAAAERISQERGILARRFRSLIPRLLLLEQQLAVAAMFMLILMSLMLAAAGLAHFPEFQALGLLIAMVVVLVIHLVFVEVFARNLVLASPEFAFRVLVIPASVLSWPLRPFLLPAILFRSFQRESTNPAALSDMHLRLLPSLSGIERVLDEEAYELIDSVREFAESTAHDIMTPRTEMEGIPHDLAPEDVYTRLGESPFSRIIVYNGTFDNVVGILLAKEVLLRRPADPYSLLRKPLFAKESTRLPELLTMIRTNRNHMIVVLDEYEGTAGLVTLHDLFEVLVGHIEDVDDSDESWVVKIDDTHWRLNGRLELWELNEELDLDLDEDEARTVGGLIFNRLGRPAMEGEVVEVGNARLTVEAMNDKRVESVLIEIVVPPADGQEEQR